MLRAAAARAEISDPRVPQNLGQQEVWNFWSKAIKADFQKQLNSLPAMVLHEGPLLN
jgi:hypothetical protein